MASDFFPKTSRDLKVKFVSPNLAKLFSSSSYSYSSHLQNRDYSISFIGLLENFSEITYVDCLIQCAVHDKH